MNGWTGRVLEINLSNESSRIIEPGSAVYEKFIGGRGLCGHYLRPAASLDPESPDMPLLIFTGPLNDTPSPTHGRAHIMSRSPLTGAVGDTSVGGRLAVEIKRAGYDGIIIRGKATAPRGIMIADEKIEFRDASDIWKGFTGDVTALMPEGGSTAVIGPAAVNGVRFANICVDGHFFSGRCGLGITMASKNLKYIHVAGSGKTEVHDRESAIAAREDILRMVSASPALMGEFGISRYGTGALYDLINARNMMPTDNFRATSFAGSKELNAPAYSKLQPSVKGGCAGCHIQCKHLYTADRIPKPEYETMAHFTALVGNTDIEAVIEANSLCNSYGMDTISAASAVACGIEITGERPGPAGLVNLIRDIGEARGAGIALAEGSAAYSRTAGMPGSAIHVKGLELPAYDPRGSYGMAMAYALSTRGGCHLRAYPIASEILRKPAATDRFSFEGKARIIKLSEDLNAVIDSLIACKFVFFAAGLEEFSRVLTAVTGSRYSGHDLMLAGERIFYNERIMNAVNGFTSAHDTLPDRFFNEAGSLVDGRQPEPISRENFDAAVQRYYRLRGLSAEGMPQKNKSIALGLEWNGL
jgi:aldehyde:ferredoxin oxidoreductase